MMKPHSACRPVVSWAWHKLWTVRLRGNTLCWLQPLTQVRQQWKFGAVRAADTILKCLKDDFMLAFQCSVSVCSVPKSTVKLYHPWSGGSGENWAPCNLSLHGHCWIVAKLETYFVISQHKPSWKGIFSRTSSNVNKQHFDFIVCTGLFLCGTIT